MLNEKGQRELAYIAQVDEIRELPGYDRVESARVNGWWCIVPKNQFQVGDLGVYFEVDSKVDTSKPYFKFLEKRHGKIKTQKMCKSISQGLLMAAEDFDWTLCEDLNDNLYINDKEKNVRYDKGDFLTERLGVKYSIQEDNNRKSNKDKYRSMYDRHKKLFRHQPYKYLYSIDWGKKLLFLFFGKKKDNKKHFPTHFEYIHKTDQERCENMPWVLEDKTPFIVTEKCDGSSATYILERKSKNKFEFYVCSRNVRMLNDTQENYHTTSKGELNVYWEIAKKYDIEEKLIHFLNKNPDLKYVCWQGELCGPKIQGNPQELEEKHLFLFHMIDSDKGMYDIREAKKTWDWYEMESVPILGIIVLPDDFEQFKREADGIYDSSVCGKGKMCAREGFVYYKTDDPNFSFKNVSREYLLKKGE